MVLGDMLVFWAVVTSCIEQKWCKLVLFWTMSRVESIPLHIFFLVGKKVMSHNQHEKRHNNQHGSYHYLPTYSLPETNIAPENGWLEY